MENVPKTPQERALQMSEAIPVYSGYYKMTQEEADRLQEEARNIRGSVFKDTYLIPDSELSEQLSAVETRAMETGAFDPTKGQGAAERIAHTEERNRADGYTRAEAKAEGMDLESNGILHAIRKQRRIKDKEFSEPTDAYLAAHGLDHQAEKESVEALLERTVDIATMTAAERATLAQAFPSGNFLYHGAPAESLLGILESGNLANFKALQAREAEAARAEGRDPRTIRRNSGFEGISWSMNKIDALPGNRYHLAGFVAAPETVLGGDEQLVVPSRPAPHEVLQLRAEVDAAEYYDAKTQFELYRTGGMFGEANSVFSSIKTLERWAVDENHGTDRQPLLYDAEQKLGADPQYEEGLRKLYSIDPNGTIHLSPDLSQQEGFDVSVASVWLQAAVDIGRFNGTSMEGMSVAEIIKSVDAQKADELIQAAKLDWKPCEQKLEQGQETASAVEVPVENMYFVAPRKDAAKWLKILARSPHKPAGVLLYDGKKVRLENFASRHRGNHEELSRELQSAIPPRDGHLAYSEVIGTEFTEEKRTGAAHQVIAERHLGGRRTIKKIDGKLVVE